MSRGPYKRHTRLRVVDPNWREGEAFVLGTTRWLIKTITKDGQVTLQTSSTVNHSVRWNTTLGHLPEKSLT
ncbi:hypothetical protein CH252_18975 [Rhodococcus sp. 06-1477-1B]|nr:hypothetical protein CH252_18975 [Rhodococcus sp. 06-1477-1B]